MPTRNKEISRGSNRTEKKVTTRQEEKWEEIVKGELR